jgi:hypothetical protein
VEHHLPEQCYCHGARCQEAQPLTEREDAGAEWAYVFEEEEPILYVCHRTRHPQNSERFWDDAGRIKLDRASETNWTRIKCGENYERCSHYPWFHFPDLRGTVAERLGTQKFLGREPMRRHDAIAYVLKGIRYKGHRMRLSRRIWNTPRSSLRFSPFRSRLTILV